MKQNAALVITSIAAPNKVLKMYAEECGKRDIPFYVVGDEKSPPSFDLPGCHFLSIAQQDAMNYRLAKILPHKTYARKNIGYILAMRNGAEYILETDDDNYPLSGFFDVPEQKIVADVVDHKGWVNVYRYFSDHLIWPRGLPLRHVQAMPPERDSLSKITGFCPIQQRLADANPDVDAVYRFVGRLPFHFDASRESIILQKNAWCPFNSQNTVFFRAAFPLLYLPATCGFRQTDIWRSFVAQRIAWENDWNVAFFPASARQDRNEHDLLKDFSDEVEGYLHNERLCQELSALKLDPGIDAIADNMRRCYRRLYELQLVEEKELVLLEGWLADVYEIL